MFPFFLWGFNVSQYTATLFNLHQPIIIVHYSNLTNVASFNTFAILICKPGAGGKGGPTGGKQLSNCSGQNEVFAWEGTEREREREKVSHHFRWVT
jgi:hypothetical protein